MTPAHLERPVRQRTLLLVDDEENIISALRRLLRRDGYRILSANSGAAGLDLLLQNDVDVIVSDQRMPGMSGVEFLREARQHRPDSVRMVLSGYTEFQSITDAINEGAIYRFLTKPWDDEQIRTNIAEAFRHKELADENRWLSLALHQSNHELAEANQRLRYLLEEKQQQLARDEATLGISQEILQCLALPLVGVDDERSIVFANREADLLFIDQAPLLGLQASECLPPPLLALLDGVAPASIDWLVDQYRWRVICRPMGSSSRSRGWLLMLQPQAGNGHGTEHATS
jgi:response regulator RpfG family c-di-GMP phosphodiesterase